MYLERCFFEGIEKINVTMSVYDWKQLTQFRSIFKSNCFERYYLISRIFEY